MKCILLGCPGAGKGTQSQMISAEFNIPQISTGDMLRKEISFKSELGTIAEKYMNKGELLPDHLIVKMVNARILQEDCENGFLLDGFPRNLSQAQALRQSGVTLDAVIEIQVPEADILERLTGRRIHQPSGRSYHIKFNPPKVEDCDDETGEPLIHRKDDHAETIKKRLEIYYKQISEIKPFYEAKEQTAEYFVVNGVGEIEEISKQILSHLTIFKLHKKQTNSNRPKKQTKSF